MTLGSLFSGSGGFELAASLNGITPVWASEIQAFPIAVTKARFPHMKHYGDVCKLKGDEIEPVDIVSFGSPYAYYVMFGIAQYGARITEV